MHTGNLFLVSAPSGAGKTSIVNAALAADAKLVVAVSHTTRPARGGEVDGKNYHFISDERFSQMIDSAEFLEHANVFGNRYGTSKAEVTNKREQGQDVILEIDWQGAQTIQSVGREAISIFIAPPTKQELENRLRKRGKDSEETISIRMSQATSDMKKAESYNYVVVNDSFETATNQLLTIISAERLRTSHQIKSNETLASLLSPK